MKALVLTMLLILAACGPPPECESNRDCQRAHFEGRCVDEKCVYTPIPGECGNEICEEGENKCTCDLDCGTCSGSEGKYLTKQCDLNDECSTLIKSQKGQTYSDEDSAGGDKYRLVSTYLQPFDVEHDQYEVRLSLLSPDEDNSQRTIRRIEISAENEQRSRVTIGDKPVTRPIWTGSKYDVKEKVLLEVPGRAEEGTLERPEIKITVDYIYKGEPKTETLEFKHSKAELNWAAAESTEECDCDDNNPGTRDVCDKTTDYICEHRPISNACGNYKCDTGENKCTCDIDCGPCRGEGAYTSQRCVQDQCKTVLKSYNAEEKNLFDEKDAGRMEMNINYKYPQPFNTQQDSFTIDFELTSTDEGVSSPKIDTIRVLDGSEQLAVKEASLALSKGSKKTVTIAVDPFASPEEERSASLTIWYSYSKDGETETGSFDKDLGDITFLSP